MSAHFLVMGLVGGVWMARIPSAKSQVHLSDGTLGIALLSVPAGLVLGAALAERLVDRVGSRVLCRICGAASCAAYVIPGLAHTLPELMAGLFVIGAAGGILDVSSNAQGVRVEAAYGRPVMTSMHAFYSLGAILGSLAGGGLAWAGVGLLPSLTAVGAVGVLIDGTAGPWLLPENSSATRSASDSALPARASAASGAPAPASAPAASASAADAPASAPAAEPYWPDGPEGQLYWPDGPTAKDRSGPRAPRANTGESPSTPSGPNVTESTPDARKRVRRLVLALAVLGVCGLVGEGAAGDWSAVYLKDNLGASAGLAALGFSAFSVTMTLGRGVATGSSTALASSPSSGSAA